MAGMAESTISPLSQRFIWGRPDQPRNMKLIAEFTVLFIAFPIGIALFLPPGQLFGVLFLFSLFGLIMLWRTDGFDWLEMIIGWKRPDWRLLVYFTMITFVISAMILYLSRPDALFSFLHRNPRLLLLVWLLYPILSALPQEIVFRVLFFNRYGRLFTGPKQAVFVNSVIFSLGHLMYWSWIVTVLTFFGGLAFAVAYLNRGLPWVWALHALAGNILFTVGMGVYFYSGNAVRPF